MKSAQEEEKRARALSISSIDSMNGLDFEHYVARLLKTQGYTSIAVSKGSGDFGIDITADKDGMRYAIQVKRQESKVSRRAISDAVAGRLHFSSDVAMVVTNSYFSESARKLAASTDCKLIDRDVLTRWISEYQGDPLSVP